jgi:TetR/AcrR family transcriptional regulator, transcriptional repressor for nem operon
MQVSVKGVPRPTPDRVLDLAEELVQTRGFHGFSYGDIAGGLGITRAALHYHYRGKAELGAALIDRYHGRFSARLDEIDATATSYAERLQHYVDIYRGVFGNGRMCLCGMLAAEFVTLDEPLREALLAFFDTNYGWLADTLQAGREAGEIAFVGESRETAELLVSTLEGAMLLNRPAGNLDRFEDIVTRLLAQFTAARGR